MGSKNPLSTKKVTSDLRFYPSRKLTVCSPEIGRNSQKGKESPFFSPYFSGAKKLADVLLGKKHILNNLYISQMVVKNGDFALSHGTKYKNNWLVVSTHLKKYARQTGSFPQVSG